MTPDCPPLALAKLHPPRKGAATQSRCVSVFNCEPTTADAIIDP